MRLEYKTTTYRNKIQCRLPSQLIRAPNILVLTSCPRDCLSVPEFARRATSQPATRNRLKQTKEGSGLLKCPRA